MQRHTHKPLAMAVSLILFGSIEMVQADTTSVLQELDQMSELPMTGDPAQDEAFKKQWADAIARQSETDPLPKNLQRRFDDLMLGVQLDEPDLELAAKGISVQSFSTPMMTSSNVNVIKPDNIRSMPLGASIWSNESLFVRRSVFDMGILTSESLIPNLQGETEAGMSSMVSSRTDKKSNSDKFTQEYGAAARLGGWQASAGYKHETAKEKTSMGGKATVSVYNYATNTLRIEPLQGTQYRELRGALRGANLAQDEILSYIAVKEYPANPSDVADPRKYKRITVIKPYDGKLTLSPRAHIQALLQLELLFGTLGAQYIEHSDARIKQETLLDMQNLKVAINASIKAFYDNYGDSFVTEVSGYREVEGQGELVQQSLANNNERNQAGTLTGGYNSFIGGVEVSASVAKWAKDADAYGASQSKVYVHERPNNGTDLSGYNKDLQGWLNAAIKDTGNAAALPAVQIQPSFPTPPKARPWQDDPFAPPDQREFKDFGDWKKSRELFKESKAYRIPKWLKNKQEQEQEGLNKPANPELARQSLAQELNGDNRNSNPRARALSAGVVDEVFLSAVENEPVQAQSFNLAGIDKALTESKNSGGVYGKTLYHKVRHELKALKAYGKKLNAQERRHLKRPGTWATLGAANARSKPDSRLGTFTATTEDTSAQELILDKMLVSNFKALPFTAVLEALRPEMKMPVPIESAVDGFINVTVLLTTLNRYQTLDTYLNFIKSIPESELAKTSIPANVSRFTKHLEDEVMNLVQTSMSSGADISDDIMASILNLEIVGMSSDGKTRDPKATKLYELLGQNMDAYNYVYTLAENPEYYQVIGRAPGGYLPLAPIKKGFIGQGYCLPKLTEVRQLDSFEGANGYKPTYLHANECIELTASTDIPSLLAGSPQTPMFPLYRFIEQTQPLLNFVQFVGGSRLIIGRDVTFAAPLGNVTGIPRTPTAPASDTAKRDMGYKPNMLGDADQLMKMILVDNWFGDERLSQPSNLNAFLPNDVSWKYSLWYPDNPEASVSGYEKNQILAARIGMYANSLRNYAYKTDVIGSRESFLGRGIACAPLTTAYCPAVTYQFLAPYSFNIDPDSPNIYYRMGGIYEPPYGNYLTGPTGQVDAQGKPVIGAISLNDVGHSIGTRITGGLLVLYPLTTDMLKGLGSGAFTYSSGSNPKDIFNMNDKGESPFDAGFTRGLLQQ